MPGPAESDLYDPIKALLEGQGYEVKGEVADCDLVALRDGEEPIIVELKTSFSLPLLLQGVRRQAVSDCVYLAFPRPDRPGRRGAWHKKQRDILKLCRRLGLGLMTVRLDPDAGHHVAVHLDPGPYQPRQVKKRKELLLREFQHRVGDPNTGGTNKRPIVTRLSPGCLEMRRCDRSKRRAKPGEDQSGNRYRTDSANPAARRVWLVPACFPRGLHVEPQRPGCDKPFMPTSSPLCSTSLNLSKRLIACVSAHDMQTERHGYTDQAHPP